MSDSEHSDTPATYPLRKKILLTYASRLLGEDVAAAHQSPPVEQQWLLTRAGLLLCASGLSATGYYLFIGMSFSQIPGWAQYIGAVGVWLFVIFLDRAVSAIRHGGSGSVKTAAVCVRLVIAIALTSATSLAFTAYFAHEKLYERIHGEYQGRIAPLRRETQPSMNLKRRYVPSVTT